MYILLLRYLQKRKHKRTFTFFRDTKVQCRWIWNWMQMKMENIKKWHICLLLAAHSLLCISLVVTKKIRLLLLLTAISAISGDCWGTCRAQLRLLPDCDASSTQKQISSVVQHFRANQNLFWTGAPSKARNGMSEGGLHCKLLESGKSNIIAGIEAHRFCLLYMLYRITWWGEGKSTSIMQSPAAYTLPVKLLTSANDFLMIGPSIPQSCLTNSHPHTCARHTSHTSAPTHIRNEFYQGNCIRLNGSLQTPFPLTLLYSISNEMLSFPCMTYLSQTQYVWCLHAPNDCLCVRRRKLSYQTAASVMQCFPKSDCTLQIRITA